MRCCYHPSLRRNGLRSTLVMIVAVSSTVCGQQPGSTPAFSSNFDPITQVPADWTTQGSVAIDTKEAITGGHSMVLARSQSEVEQACSVVTPTFPTKPGLWNVSVGIKTALYSPDSSFDGIVTLECLDVSGKVIDPITIADVYGRNSWKAYGAPTEIPKDTVSARFRIELRKTYGQLWIDELTASYMGQAPPKHVDRLVFSTVALGNLLYPTDSRVVSLTVVAPDELPEASRVVKFVIRDYWGAEQMAPVAVPLTEAPKEEDDFVYKGTIDLAQVPLEMGKYYEMHGEIPFADKPFRNHSGLAILPEAVTNRYAPEEVPFSGRNWDGRIGTGFDLSHRLGIRIMNIWSGWDPVPPYAPRESCIELAEKYKMGVIFGTPSYGVERHAENWKLYDDKAMREGVKNLINTYGKLVHPCYLSLGNEPPVVADRIADDVKAYRSIYEAAKEVDPKVVVISTSVGPSEEFFRAGFGKYCDVYDFHCYEDPRSIGTTMQRYRDLFKRYGDEKPVWSTEIGLNSEGVSRHAVAIDMVKKYAMFFAAGGLNMSWFDLFYPDPKGRGAESNAASFDVFDSRYVKYNPKLTAISDYDMINAISIKKFVAQKQYGDDMHAYLFRDRDNHDLQVVWKDAGRKDVFLPLPGVADVTVVKLDGTHRNLDAGGRGVTLSMGEEPLLLLYDGAAPLAENFGDPDASLAAVPAGLVRGGSVEVAMNLHGASADEVRLVPPPFWQVTRTPRAGAVTFTVTAPAASEVREAEMTLVIGGGKGAPRGELYFRVPVIPQVSSRIVPIAASGKEMPGAKLVLKNNGTAKQEVSWTMALTDQVTLKDGSYSKHEATQAHFISDAKGQVSLDPGGEGEIALPIAATDPLTPYRVRAVVTDSTGATAIRDRYLGGFVAVPRLKGEIKLDGTLDEADWRNAPVEKIDEARQYRTFDPANVRWRGPADLSGTVRFLWDDRNLYVGVEVTDDIAGGLQEGSNLWQQDGLQFLIDPCRGRDENVGKYDYSIADGKKGLQAWCDLSANAGAPNGLAPEIKLSDRRKGDGTGAITYELAIPWTRLAPFQPGPGADLGLAMILNEDDGKGRKSFMTWFGDVSNKVVSSVGDLILQP